MTRDGRKLAAEGAYTYYVEVNITLSIDEELAERAREVAKAHGLSLNELIRSYLASVTGTSSRAELSDRYRSFRRARDKRASERSWTREDAYVARRG